MKKFLVIIAVLALTLVSSVAMAEVTFDGSIEFLMRSFKNTSDWNDKATGSGDYRTTYERVRFGINAKNDAVKGRIQIENDWDQWGSGAGAPGAAAPNNQGPNPGFETRPDNALSFREAWLDFTIPGAAPAHFKVGRQFLQLGNGWFFRSAKYGSDAWVVGLPGKNTIAFVNVKASENNSTLADDTDAYVLLDTFKINDQNTVGAYLAHVIDRRGTWTTNTFGAVGVTSTTLDNLGLHYSGQVGPVKLAAEIDIQSGEIKTPVDKIDLEGTNFVLQATLPMDALTISATAAMGSGDDPTTDKKMEGFLPFLDKDPRYTMIYEYLMVTAAEAKNTGFSNIMAFGLGAMFKVNKMISVGADLWMLSADQKFSNNGGTASDDIGNEIDVKVNLTLYDPLTWNTTIGMFQPGKGYEDAAGKADDVTAIQSVLSYKF